MTFPSFSLDIRFTGDFKGTSQYPLYSNLSSSSRESQQEISRLWRAGCVNPPVCRTTGVFTHPARQNGPSGKLPQEHLQTVAEAAVDAERRRRLEAAVDHAVLAARVLAVAIGVPVGIV